MANLLRCIWSVILPLLAGLLLWQEACAADLCRIGVLAARSKENCLREWSETARYLTQTVKECSFEILPLSYDEINEAVEKKRVDFLICNPVNYVELAQNSDVQRLATLKRLHAGQTVSVYGSAIFTRSPATDISDLSDLRKKSFMAVAPNAFGGWLMALREFKDTAIDPHADFSRLHFGGSQEAVVRAVQTGRVAAGAVSSGLLERMALEGAITLSDFKILSSMDYPDFPYASSTRLYPEWPFCKLEHTAEDLAEKVMLALLGMPHSSPAAHAAGCAGWTYPVVYKAVFDCLSRVQYGPYKGSGILALRELMRQYGKPLATTFAGAALLFLFSIYVLILNRQLQRSNQKTKDEIAGHQSTLALLQQSRHRAEQLLKIVPSAVMTLDRQRRITSWNDQAEALTGYTAQEAIGQSCLLCMEQSCRSQCRVFDAACAKPIFATQCTIRRKDGSFCTIEKNADLIYNELGTVVGAIESFMDITERHRAGEALRESELKFRALSDSATDAILMMDCSGAITLWNSAAEKIFGWRAEEALGSDLHNLLAPRRYHSRYGQAMPRFQETGTGKAIGKTIELLGKNRFGQEIPVELSLSAISLKGSWYAVGILRDISRRKQTQQALFEAMQAAESANAAKSRFIANMSHEIRTPMNGVMGMTGLLLGTGLTREQQDYAEAVRSSAESLLTIVNDILDFSKIEAGKMELEIIDFDLRALLESVADLMAFKAREKGLEYVWMAYPELPPLVKGDPGRLRQVLVNLVGNAVKFTRAGTVSLVVSLEQEDSSAVRLRFEVTDTGIGIPPEKIDSLFQPFVQADASTTRQYGGTGLGLSICRQLVSLMSGAVGVSSAPARGSTFWFTALLYRPDCSRAANTLPPRPDFRGRRILLADDNAINRQVVGTYLHSWNCRLEEAGCAREALEHLHAAAASDPFAVAILDMRIPGMGGEALGRAITQDPALQGCALIIMTSASSREDAGQLEKPGFAGYLPKPVKQSQLCGCLAAALGLQQTATSGTHEQPVTRCALDELQRSKIRMLVAEDNTTNQKVAVGILRNLGFRADTVANGLEAVRQIERIPYDLIFMDVQMPEMDGFEATRAIRKMENRKDIPIIAMTAGALPQDRAACLSAGMNDYIAKPIQPSDIAEKIYRWLAAEGSSGPAIAARSAAADTASAFDGEDLLQRLMGDGELLRSIVSGFMATLPQYLAAIRDTLAQQDCEALRRGAHNLKGSAANVGANALSAVAQQIEQAGQAGDFAAVQASLAMLEQQAALFVEAASAQGFGKDHAGFDLN